MKRDEVYLGHIYDACLQIATYTEGFEKNQFLLDRKTQDAVVRQLEIVGEASRQLSDSFKQQYVDIPWYAIRGMRNRIAHDYINIDVEVVWEVVKVDVPVLKKFTEKWAV